MKNSKKMCARDKVIVALNADKEKHLNYKTTTSGNTIRNICVSCHDSEKFESFGVPKKINFIDVGYARVTFPEMMMLKEKASLKLFGDNEGQLFANSSGNTLRLRDSIAIFLVLALKRR